MLEGLEVSEILFSIVNKDIFRLDSEPFQKINLVEYKNVQTVQFFEIAKFNPVKSEISKLDRNKTVSFIPMALMGNGVINDKEEGTINDYIKAGYTYFAENDILIAKITPCMEHGKCAIAKDLINKIGFGSTEYNVFRINDKRFLKEYVFAFLNREIIRKQAENNMIGTSGRQRVPISFYEKIEIPIFSLFFQNAIKELFDNSHIKSKLSKSKYSQAESLLLKTLGLEDFEPSEEAVNIKNFSESFGASGRLDAEYYQVKYEDMFKKIKSKTNELKPLSYFIDNYSTGYAYKSDTYIQSDGVPLIRINNIVDGNLDIDNAIHIPKKDIYLSVKDIVKEDDILISMSGTIGSSCKIPKGVKAVVNQRIMRITSKNINVEVLPLIINSIIGKLQLERIGTGGVQTNISSSDISNILIPFIDLTIQQQIASLIKESFSLKSESERLLEVAKTAVEMAIEEGEEKAMEYIKKNIAH